MLQQLHNPPQQNGKVASDHTKGNQSTIAMMQNLTHDPGEVIRRNIRLSVVGSYERFSGNKDTLAGIKYLACPLWICQPIVYKVLQMTLWWWWSNNLFQIVSSRSAVCKGTAATAWRASYEEDILLFSWMRASSIN